MPEATSIKISIERILLCTEGESSKFWRVRVEGNVQVVCYGRIGTEGHELTKTFEGSVAASKGTEKLITEKLGKGYREVSEAEAEIAHTAARSVSGGEGMPVGFSRKTRRFAKGKASGVQLCLSFIPEGKLEIVPPASLSLEF